MDRNDQMHPTGGPAGIEPDRDSGAESPDLHELEEGVEALSGLDPAEVAAPAAEIADALSALLEASEVDR